MEGSTGVSRVEEVASVYRLKLSSTPRALSLEYAGI
jgi:hypothetical protein